MTDGNSLQPIIDAVVGTTIGLSSILIPLMVVLLL